MYLGSMFAYELLPRLKYLTLTVENDAEYWQDRLVFIGTEHQWHTANMETLGVELI